MHFGKITRNKKGDLQGIMFLAVVLLVFSVTVLLTYMLSSKLDDQIQTIGAIPQNAKDASSSLTGSFTSTYDSAFLMLTIGIMMVIMILAALVKVHPIFIPLYIIGLIIFIFFAAVLSNIYQDLAANAAISGYAADLTFINIIMTYLPLIIGTFGFMVMVILYKIVGIDQ